MKLNLLFIVMEVLTILAYPFVFMHGKLLQFTKARESIQLANGMVTAPVVSGK